MLLFKIVETIFLLFCLLFLTTQLIIPLLRASPVFPLFASKEEKLLIRAIENKKKKERLAEYIKVTDEINKIEEEILK